MSELLKINYFKIILEFSFSHKPYRKKFERSDFNLVMIGDPKVINLQIGYNELYFKTLTHKTKQDQPKS